MSNVWIYLKDKNSYIMLMNQMCEGPQIQSEKDDKVLVDFCHSAMSAWVQAGYWYSMLE